MAKAKDNDVVNDEVNEVTPAYPVTADLSGLPEILREAASGMIQTGGDGVMERRIAEIWQANAADEILGVEPVDIEDVCLWPGAMTLRDFTLHQGDKLDQNNNPTIYAAMQLSGKMEDGTPWHVITTCGGRVLMAQLVRLKYQDLLPKENVKFRADDTSAGNTVYSLVNAKPVHPFRRYQG